MLNEQRIETTEYSLDDKTPPPAQRRKNERHLSLLRVATLIIGDRRELCLVKNVSAGGMLIRAYSDIPEGVELSIELRQGQPLCGTVRWKKDDCIGVTFAARVDVLDLISVSVDGPRQRMPRVAVDTIAWVRDGAIVHRVSAGNISQGGVRITTPKELRVGAEVVVTLIGLPPSPGLLRWKDGEQYGIRFNRPLALPALVEWLREQQDQMKLKAAG